MITDNKLKLDIEHTRRRASILNIKNKNLGIDIEFHPLLKSIALYQNNKENFSDSIDDNEKKIINNEFQRINYTGDEIVSELDFAHKLEMIIRYRDIIKIEGAQRMNRDTLINEAFPLLKENSIRENARKLLSSGNIDDIYNYLLNIYIRSQLKSVYDNNGKIKIFQINLIHIHNNPEKQNDDNSELVQECYRQREKIINNLTNEYKKQFTTSNPATATPKLFEKMIFEISDKLKSIDVNDEMQPDYFFAINGIIEGLEIIYQNIKINDDLKSKINNYVNKINLYEIINESNIDTYKVINQISQCISKISSDVNLFYNPYANEQMKTDAKNQINEGYKELKTLVNSLEKDSPLKQLLEDIIEFVKELFNIPPFTFKFTASHGQDASNTLEINKNCAQELNEKNKDASQGMILRYIN